MEYSVIVAIIALIVSLITIMTPILKLNSSITKLNTMLDVLSLNFNESKAEQKEQGKKIDNHEKRITILEHER